MLDVIASRRPVIATNWGGAAVYLDSTRGILVKPEGPLSLVAWFAFAMQKLIDNPKLAASMGNAGRERVANRFNWQRMIDQVNPIYQSLTEDQDASSEQMESRIAPAVVSTQDRD